MYGPKPKHYVTGLDLLLWLEEEEESSMWSHTSLEQSLVMKLAAFTLNKL